MNRIAKDWTGNKKATFVTLGASNHSEHEREKHDFYSTDPSTLEIFLKVFLERTDISYDDKFVYIAINDNEGLAFPKDDVENIEIE